MYESNVFGLFNRIISTVILFNAICKGKFILRGRGGAQTNPAIYKVKFERRYGFKRKF